MHVLEKAVASGNRASSGSNMVKKGVVDFVKSVRLVRSIVIFGVPFIA